MKYLLMILVIVAGCTKPSKVQADDRKRIYVLDTEVSPTYLQPSYICNEARRAHDFLGHSYNPHGANISEIIGKQIDTLKYCVFPVSVFKGRTSNFSTKKYLTALKMISKDTQAVAVNMSLSGYLEVKGERVLISNIAKRNIKIVVSAGNEALTLTRKACPIFPACFHVTIKEVIVVSAIDVDTANKVEFDHVIAPGRDRGYSFLLTGTSQSAAEHTATLYKKEE